MILQIVLLFCVIGFFQVDDMTLGQGEVDSFNTGWTLSYPDGRKVQMNSLPYYSECKAGDVLVMERKVPEKYYGKTMFFLSADKELAVKIDGQEIYSFGKNDKRLFGHTPGSVFNFVDIPQDCESGMLQIEMVSSYDNYAAYISDIRIADRDVAILRILKENMINILCSIILAFSGIILLVLGLLQRLTGEKDQGVLYLGVLLVWGSIYYAIETKILHIIYGNQTLYSMIVFLFLMYMPIFLIHYYMQLDSYGNKKSYKVILISAYCNVVCQFVLQVFNIRDFMDMAFLSHTLIFVTIILVLINYIKKAKREGWGMAWLEMAALLIMVGGSIIDLGRTYVIKVGDFGKFSRYGTTIYGLIMVYMHIRRMVRNATEEIEENKRYLEQEVTRKTEQIRDMLRQTIDALSNTVDAKDCYTNGHSKRVAKYSKMLAEKMGTDLEKQDEIYFAGLLHDVGKIRIPDEIIKKEGKLTDEEFNYIKIHPVSGYHILKGISEFSMISTGAKYHHERYDGKGYPNGLSGQNIPLVARIIGVADAYDAMTSNRCYRDALPQKIVRNEIVNGRGSQFDPEIADYMLEIIDEDKEYFLRQNEFYQKKILVVDEDSDIQKDVESVFKDNPMYQVVGCDNSKEALDLLSKQEIHLILLDIEMLVTNGFETIKNIQEKNNIPVVLMSADRGTDFFLIAEEMGADDYLMKPFPVLQLNEIVHSILENC